MPPVTKREAARGDLVGHFVYLAANAGLDVADRFLANAEAGFQDLAQQPRMGGPLTLNRPGLAGLRTWRVKGFDNHLVFYQPRPDGVSVVRVLRAASDRWSLLGFEDQPMAVARGHVCEEGLDSGTGAPTAQAPIPSGWGVVKIVVNGIAAALTMAVLLVAIAIPPVIGRGGTPSEHLWQLGGVGVFFGALVAVLKKTNFSLLFLFLACAFFFVSCAANFYWKGG